MPPLEYVMIQCAQQEDLTGRDQARIKINGDWVADVYIDSGEARYVYADHSGGTMHADVGAVIEFYEVDAEGDDFLGSGVVTQADVDAGYKDVDDVISSAKYLFHVRFGKNLSDSDQ